MDIEDIHEAVAEGPHTQLILLPLRPAEQLPSTNIRLCRYPTLLPEMKVLHCTDLCSHNHRSLDCHIHLEQSLSFRLLLWNNSSDFGSFPCIP